MISKYKLKLFSGILGLAGLSIQAHATDTTFNRSQILEFSASPLLLAQNEPPTELNCSNPITYRDIDGDGILEKCCPFKKDSEGPPYLCLLSGGGGSVGPIW